MLRQGDGEHVMSSETTAPSRLPRRVTLTLGITLVAIAAGGGWWWLWSTNPHSLIEKASRCRRNNPKRAVQLLQQVIAEYPSADLEARTVLASVRLQQEAWDARPTGRRRPSRQRPTPALSELADRAARLGRNRLAHRVLTAVSQRPGPRQLFPWSNSSHPAVLEGPLPHGHAGRTLANLEPENPRWWWLTVDAVTAGGNTSELVDVLGLALQQRLPQRDTTELRHRLIEQTILLGDATAARDALPDLESGGPKSRQRGCISTAPACCGSRAVPAGTRGTRTRADAACPRAGRSHPVAGHHANGHRRT
ncbi:MAG: hypothetical protein Ct9H300mP1_23220 [Planctomycetaceae bacterium]|nr:MAG: hypothetical protein Ct9H300mP1_23220 [Planctomycetaceae bacterium]